MTSLIHQPHDKFFKQSMSEIIVAKEFFEAHLPENFLKKIDLTTLELEKNSFIDEAYKATEADVVYSVRMADSQAYIYLLCEHQSEVDPIIALRLHVYIVRIMEMHLKKFPNDPIPFVYPLIVYSGDKIWDAPPDIFSLFGENETLAREWFLKPYQMLDIQRMTDLELRRHLCSGLIEFSLKCRRAFDLENYLENLFSWLQELIVQNPRGEFIGRTVLYYMMDIIEEKNKELFITKIQQQLSSKYRGETMTLRESFERDGFEKGIKQGMEQGIEQGIKQGIREGIAKGEREMLLRLLQRKFGPISKQHQYQIEQADIEQLQQWSDTLFFANSIDACLGKS